MKLSELDGIVHVVGPEDWLVITFDAEDDQFEDLIASVPDALRARTMFLNGVTAVSAVSLDTLADAVRARLDAEPGPTFETCDTCGVLIVDRFSVKNMAGQTVHQRFEPCGHGASFTRHPTRGDALGAAWGDAKRRVQAAEALLLSDAAELDDDFDPEAGCPVCGRVLGQSYSIKNGVVNRINTDDPPDLWMCDNCGFRYPIKTPDA